MRVNWVTIGLDNGLLPIQITAEILSIGFLGTKFSEILIKLQNLSFMKMHLKILCVKWWPFFADE